MQIDRERLAHVLAKALTGGGLSRPKSIDHTAIIKVLADIEAQGFVIVPREPAEAMIEAACRTHCDYFGGVGWWDTGLIADTKPKAIEAMQAAYAAMSDAGKGEGNG